MGLSFNLWEAASCRQRLFFGLLSRGLAGKFKDKTGALAHTLAVRGQGTAHFLRHAQATVQAETMALLARGETVGEQAGEIFRGNAGAVVLHFNLDAPLR